jgi:integrase
MARILGRLNSRLVMTAVPPEGKDRAMIPDGGNLYLQLAPGKDDFTRSWVFKFEMHGRRREMGLGGLHSVSLAEARLKARKLRNQIIDGIDPFTERVKQRQVMLAERAKAVTFRAVAKDYLALHLPGFRNAKHQYQWERTLEVYVLPKIGSLSVGDVQSADVLKCIEPIWRTKGETAARVKQRIERILDYATTRQLRSGDNPATHVLEALPKRNGGQVHHKALPYSGLPQFMLELRQREGIVARALEYAILTATRTGETVGATWVEIDLKTKTWTIPAERMKASKEHRVPLCDRALDILREIECDDRDDCDDHNGNRLFALSYKDAMMRLLQNMRPGQGLTVHGFRSSFRDWISERTSTPNNVAELALAHAIKSKVEAAYRRGDLLEQRRRLMQQWADYCASPPVAAERNVVPMRSS